MIAGEIPCAKVYEDADVLAILDISPVNPGHTLVFPKKHTEGSDTAEAPVLKHLIIGAQKVARMVMEGMGMSAYNLYQNNGKAAGQAVPHLHFHVIPRHEGDGRELWHGAAYKEGEMDAVLAKIKLA